MSDREDRVVKEGRVRVAEQPVRIGERSGGTRARQEKENEDEAQSELQVERQDDGRVSAIIIRCRCGEVIQVNCRYTGGKPDESG